MGKSIIRKTVTVILGAGLSIAAAWHGLGRRITGLYR